VAVIYVEPCRGDSGIVFPVVSGELARGALNVDARGDDGGLTNIDFVPSTKRPPRGGPSARGGANDVCWGPGEDGPAPGDCGGRDLTLAEVEVAADAASGKGG